MSFIGLDIGGTDIKAVRLNEKFEIISEVTQPSNASQSPAAVRTAIQSVIAALTTGSNFSEIKGIGVGCAGSVSFDTGIVRNSPNFKGWKNVPLRDWLVADFSRPSFVDNDANCAALAECRLGAGKGSRNLVLLTIGTGIGGGLILNGQLYRGSTGTGGELGHVSIFANGVPCPCGNRGCIERYCSGSAILKRTGKTSREVFQSTLKEHTTLIDEFIEHLSIGLTSFSNIFDPDMILLGGAVSQGIEKHLVRIRHHVAKQAFPAVGEHVQIKLTKFGNNSGAIGAALLVAEK